MAVLEERGLFWWSDEPIPENHFAPEKCVAGALSIGDEGFTRLDLDGYLVDPKNPTPLAILDNNPELQTKCIRGLLKASSREVLLVNIQRSGGQVSFNGISHDEWSSSICLVSDSDLPRSAEQELYSSMIIDMTGYEQWLSQENIHLLHSDNGISASYCEPEPISFHDDAGTIALKFLCRKPQIIRRTDSLEMKEIVRLAFAPSELMSVSDVIKEHQVISDFLKLLTGSSLDLVWPSLTCSSSEQRIAVYFSRHKPSAHLVSREKSWVQFNEIKSDFGTLFFAYRSKRLSFGPGFYLYAGTQRELTIYEEHLFVNLVWGLESFHRRKFEAVECPVPIKNKIERIIASVENRDRRWLRKKLRHAVEPTLSDRISDLLKAIPINLDSGSIKIFSEKCAKIRNDISHFGGNRNGTDYKSFIKDVHNLNRALRIIYHALLLVEVGITKELVSRSFNNSFQSFILAESLRAAGLVILSDANAT